MMSVHLLVIGIVEGLFTVCVYNFVKVCQKMQFYRRKEEKDSVVAIKETVIGYGNFMSIRFD